MKDYLKYWNSLSEEQKEIYFTRMFKVAYRDSIDEMSADEIKRKAKEFRFKWLNLRLEEKSVDEMFALMEDSIEWEKNEPEIYDVCMNHSLKECAWLCDCDYNNFREVLLNNLVKTVDLVRKANLRPVE